MESTLPREARSTRGAVLDVSRESASRGRRLASLVASSGRDPAEMVFDLRQAPAEHRVSQFVNALVRSYEIVGAYPTTRFLAARWLTTDPFEAELVRRQIALAIRFLSAGPRPPESTVSDELEVESTPHLPGRDTAPWPPPEWFL